MSIYKKIATTLLGALVAMILWVMTPYLFHAIFPTPPSEETLPYSYEKTYMDFVKEELLIQYGKAEPGEYHFNRYGDSGEIQHARTRCGVVSVLVEDLWGDSIPELLTATLVPGENLAYSQLEVDVYEYDRITGKVIPIRRLTDDVTAGEATLTPMSISGGEDKMAVFFRGDYLCLESMTSAQSASHTLTLYHKDRIKEGPEFILRAERRTGYPMGYYLYQGEEYRSLFTESPEEEAYLEEFLNGNETPVSEEALAFLLSSVEGAEKFLKTVLSPTWQEDENILWVDGRIGYFTLQTEDSRMIMTYENRLEGDGSEPLQPAVQTVTDYTEWK